MGGAETGALFAGMGDPAPWLPLPIRAPTAGTPGPCQQLLRFSVALCTLLFQTYKYLREEMLNPLKGWVPESLREGTKGTPRWDPTCFGRPTHHRHSKMSIFKEMFI